MERLVKKTELVLSVDRAPEHERGAKHITTLSVKAMCGCLSARVPRGVIIGKDTIISLKDRITYTDGTVETRDITSLRLY